MNEGGNGTSSAEIMHLLDGTSMEVEQLSASGRFGQRALVQSGKRWRPAEIVMAAESEERDAICKNASMAQGPHSNLLLSSFDSNYWTHDGYFVQLFDEVPSCRPLMIDDLKSGAVSVRSVLYELLETLRLLHSQGYIHSGIHPKAIIVAENRCSLSDFWFVHRTSGIPFYEPLKQYYPACLGAEAMMFCAPEIYSGGAPSLAADIYSLGASILHLLTGYNHILRDTTRDQQDLLSEQINTHCSWLDEQSQMALAVMLMDYPEHRSDMAFLMDVLAPGAASVS